MEPCPNIAGDLFALTPILLWYVTAKCFFLVCFWCQSRAKELLGQRLLGQRLCKHLFWAGWSGTDGKHLRGIHFHRGLKCSLTLSRGTDTLPFFGERRHDTGVSSLTVDWPPPHWCPTGLTWSALRGRGVGGADRLAQLEAIKRFTCHTTKRHVVYVMSRAKRLSVSNTMSSLQQTFPTTWCRLITSGSPQVFFPLFFFYTTCRTADSP